VLLPRRLRLHRHPTGGRLQLRTAGGLLASTCVPSVPVRGSMSAWQRGGLCCCQPQCSTGQLTLPPQLQHLNMGAKGIWGRGSPSPSLSSGLPDAITSCMPCAPSAAGRMGQVRRSMDGRRLLPALLRALHLQRYPAPARTAPPSGARCAVHCVACCSSCRGCAAACTFPPGSTCCRKPCGATRSRFPTCAAARSAR
jgi:hypothetical protein